MDGNTVSVERVIKAPPDKIWRYELSPADGGTLVRETWDASACTLERIAEILES